MRGDGLVQNQRLLTQAIMALADALEVTIGFQVSAVPFAQRPVPGVAGQIMAFTDSTVNTFGAVIAAGGTNKVLGWYNGTNWTVIGI